MQRLDGDRVIFAWKATNSFIYMVNRQNYLKNTEIQKKALAFCRGFVYNNSCCGMIAMKREVAAHMWQVFPWSECQVRKLATSHCTD